MMMSNLYTENFGEDEMAITVKEGVSGAVSPRLPKKAARVKSELRRSSVD